MTNIPPPPPPPEPYGQGGSYQPPGGYPAGGYGRPGGYGQPGGYPPGGFGGPPFGPPNVPNYLVQAILVTLFCCLPVGIVSIVFASQVSGKLAAGDYQGALDSSQKARTWAWVAFGAGLAVTAVWIVLALAAAGSQP